MRTEPSSPLAGLARDLSHAARTLRRQPAHSALVAATMALGIGATTLLFSVVHGVLLEPLDWPQAERLVRLAESREGATRHWPWMLSNGSYLAWAAAPETVDAIAGWRRGVATLKGSGDAERLPLAEVTASLFPMLGARSEVGQLFPEQRGGEDALLVLSHELWQRRFEGRLDAVGRVVELDGSPHRIVGVMTRDFAFPDRETRAWRPLPLPPVVDAAGQPSGVALFSALARLRPGVTPRQAAAEATRLARRGPDPGLAALALFGSDGPVTVSAVPAKDAIVAEVRPGLLLLLLAAVGLLLATATANVASLQLARATARQRELALHAALGAGQARLVRLLLSESLLLGLAGGGLGLLLAWAGHRALPALLPAGFPRLDAIGLDLRVVALAVLLSLASALAFGALPALLARRLRLGRALLEGGAGALGAGGSDAARARAAILTGQVAVATLLLLGALQLGRSFLWSLGAERGYDASELLVAQLPMPDSQFPVQRRRELIERLLERVRALPSVSHAAFTSVYPLSPRESIAAFRVPEGMRGAVAGRIHAGLRDVSPGYFEALGRRLLAGRWLSKGDLLGAPDVVVVNRTVAKRYLGAEPVGEVLPIRLEEGRASWRVVGVVEDVALADLAAPPQPELLASYRQRSGVTTEPALLVRTGSGPEALAATLRALVVEADPSLAPGPVTSMQELVATSLAQPRLYSTLLGLFAASALALAGVGLFGVLSHAVALRTREIGVRMALGARPRDVVGAIASRGLLLTALGMALGLSASLGLERFLAGLLYGVQPHDVTSLLAVPALLALVAGLATALPAVRAARIDPQAALRSS